MDLEILFIEHELLFIGGFSLYKASFSNTYDSTLEQLLKKIKKQMYLPYSIFEKVRESAEIYKKYFSLQKYMVVSQEYSTIGEAMYANKNKKILVIAGSSTTGNQVLKHKKTAIFFGKAGFGLFSKTAKNVSQNHRVDISKLHTDKTKIKKGGGGYSVA